MRLLVLAALAAVAFADVSELTGYHYNAPASSYGVPQSSVTERQFNALPTAPSPSLHLPAFEHQDFNALNPLPGLAISTTPAPFVDAGFVSTTPAPILGYSGGLGSSFVSSTPAPHIEVTSGSQESLNVEHLPSFGISGGLNAFTTPAPLFSSTIAPTVSTLAPGLGLDAGLGLGLGSAYSYPGFGGGLGLDAFSTPAPIGLGAGGLGLIGDSVNVHGITSGGSINDAFGISGATSVAAGILPQPQQVSKHLYFYAAPEEPEPPRPRINVAPVAPPKKNVKIIFIKTPTPPAPAPISIAAPPQNEEKTVVYVLVKKPEDTQNIELQTPPPSPPSRPEVYFIKYKTPQEAEQAIAHVQGSVAEGATPSAAFDSLVSSTTTSLPPLLNYISTTTTPVPLLNFGGGISGPIGNPGFIINAEFDDDADISQNLISSGGQASSLFTTGSPLINSISTEGGLLGTTTVAPLIPHATYGPPIFKKK